ncbi:MAG: type II secretion system protein [Alphaproteobacteria bacterium]|nr:type II secretion system protein [Alphaproteobacteria bacterium]MBT5390102.1 type II secretion system protein [Alphaproteobacteria bacterium]MBT5655134.1 type II secretion system protein [Alphaproteobacteria bacterium]
MWKMKSFKRKGMALLKKEEGFSLLEVTIVLMILGLVSGIAIPILTHSQINHKFLKTKEIQEKILTVFAAYVLLNGRLPCPSDPLGRRGAALQTCQGVQAVGLIPFQTLGIPEAMAKDGFGRYMTYGVSPELTKEGFEKTETIDGMGVPVKKQTMLTGFYQVLPVQNLIVRNDKGEPVLESHSPVQKSASVEDARDFIALVVVSHGEKGHGAITESGVRIKNPNAGAWEQENANGDLSFVDMPYSRNELAAFDNEIRWVTRNNLLPLYGQFSL